MGSTTVRGSSAGSLRLLVVLLGFGALDPLLGGVEDLALVGHHALAHRLVLSQTICVEVSSAVPAYSGALWGRRHGLLEMRG